MVMPLWDHSPFRWPTPPYVMWGLIVVNFVVFFFQIGGQDGQMDRIIHLAGLTPISFTSDRSLVGSLPGPVTLVTYMFLHANFMHIFGNMIFLFVFGDDIEEILGHWRFLLFYLACGVCAGLAFVLSAVGTTVELIGASGAVAGVISAYLLFRPCAKVTVLLGLIPLRLRAFWVIGTWAIWQVFEVASRAQDGVAYWAHVGGLITGAALFVVMRPAGVRLFDCMEPETALPDGELPPSPPVQWPHRPPR